MSDVDVVVIGAGANGLATGPRRSAEMASGFWSSSRVLRSAGSPARSSFTPATDPRASCRTRRLFVPL